MTSTECHVAGELIKAPCQIYRLCFWRYWVQKVWKNQGLFLIVFGIFCCLIFIRVHYFFQNAPYTAEIAQHYMEIERLRSGLQLIHGSLTSHNWLRLSATPYYLFYPLFEVSGFHPLTLPWLWVILGSLMVLLNFEVVKQVFDNKTAALSSLLLAVSPIIWQIERIGGFFPFILPAWYGLFWLTHRLSLGKSQRWWSIFFVISCLFSLHAAALMLIPFYVGLIIYKRQISWRVVATSVVAFLLPQLPFLLLDVQQRFSSVIHLVAWIPYRVANFALGRTMGVGKAVVVDESVQHLGQIIVSTLLPPTYVWWLGLVLAVICGGLFLYWWQKGVYWFERLLIIFWLYGLFALLIHKNPPLHYSVPIVLLPILIVARCLVIVWEKQIRWLALLWMGIVAVCVVMNVQWIVTSNRILDSNNLSFTTQLEVVRRIVADADNVCPSVARVGAFDHYRNRFQENYTYLINWLSETRCEEKTLQAPPQYVILEDKGRLIPFDRMQLWQVIDGVEVYKRETGG